MQIVNEMESSSENNMEEKVADKERAIVCDVDLNENLSIQGDGNTVTDVNKNIAKSEKLELHDNSQISHNTIEADLSPTTENCELHISEGSDTEGESPEVYKDNSKFNGENNGENNCKACDQNNCETEKDETDMSDTKDPTPVSAGTTTDVKDKNSDSADYSTDESCTTSDSNSEKTTSEEIQDNANKSDDLEIHSENSKSQNEDDNNVPISNLTSDNRDLTEKCKKSSSEATTKDDSSSEETFTSAENSTKCNDGNSYHQDSDIVDSNAAKPCNEENIVDENCNEEIQGNDDNTNDSVNNDDKESTKSEIEMNDSEKNSSVIEYSASEKKVEDVKDTPKDSNPGNQPETENEVELSKLSENVSEEKHEDDCNVDSTEITPSSETASETSNCADSSKDGMAQTDSKDNLEHIIDGTASAQREQESITETKKEIETEVDTNLSENASNVNSHNNIETVEGGQVPSNAVPTSEVQQVDKQVETDICNDKCQTVDTTSETIPLEKSDLQSDSECDRIEHIAENDELGAMQPLDGTVTEDMRENVDGICDGIPKVEKGENDNDEAVQTEDKEMDTSSTQTVPRESKDQSSETNTQNVGSVETQTPDQIVKCEHKKTGTDTVEEAKKTEVCDKETSVSTLESTDKSVQTESETNAGDLSKLEERFVEEIKQSIEPENFEQAIQTDKQETSSLMTQTENLDSKKEQAVSIFSDIKSLLTKFP